MQKFKTILVDVPLASNQRKDGNRNPEQHYSCMSVDELKQMKIPADEDCLLLFWAWNQRLIECLDIIQSWGFTYKTMITWVKPHMGIGNYIRNATEHILIATKGKNSINPAKRHLSWFIAERRKHSRKPEQQYDIAEILGHPPYLELFARRKREGWFVWGNEIASLETLNPTDSILTEDLIGIMRNFCLHKNSKSGELK